MGTSLLYNCQLRPSCLCVYGLQGCISICGHGSTVLCLRPAHFGLFISHLTAESAVKLQVSSSSGKGVASSKGGKAAGGKAKDPIQERKEAQLADEAQVHQLLLYLSHFTLSCVLIS